MKVEQERVKNLLTDTVTLLCKNGLQFHKELKVQGLLGITLDDSDVFIVHINEAFGGEVVAVRTEEVADSSALGLSPVTHGEREPSSSGAEKHKHRSQRSHFNTNKKRRNSAESPNDATPVRHKQHKQEPGIGQGSEDEPIHVKTEPDDFMLLDSCDRQAELNLRLAPDIIIPGSTSSGSQVNDQSNSSYSDQCPSVGNHGGRGQYISGIVRHSQSDPSTPGTSAMDMGGGHSAYGGTPGEQALQDTSWGTQPESQGSQSTQNTVGLDFAAMGPGGVSSSSSSAVAGHVYNDELGPVDRHLLLLRHRRPKHVDHPRLKPHACTEPGCSRRFYNRREMYRHQRVNHGRPYVRPRVPFGDLGPTVFAPPDGNAAPPAQE